MFGGAVYAPTLEGQYILKNLVLIGGGLVLGATVRGGRIVAEPELAAEQRRAQIVPPSGPQRNLAA